MVKIGFLAKFHADFTYFHNFSTDFLKIMIFENLIFLKMGQNHVFKGFGDDLEARIGISMKKRVLDMGSNYFFDGFQIFGIFTSMRLFLWF